jgi:hypothetical protein
MVWTVIEATGTVERVEALDHHMAKARLGGDLRVIVGERGALMFARADGIEARLAENPIASGLVGQRIVGPVLFVNRFGVDVVGAAGQRVASSGGVIVLEGGAR